MAYMSQKGYDDLVAKLKHMESVDRPAASAAIAEARDMGDLSGILCVPICKSFSVFFVQLGYRSIYRSISTTGQACNSNSRH